MLSAACLETLALLEEAKGDLNRYALDYPLCAVDLHNGGGRLPGSRGGGQSYWIEIVQRAALHALAHNQSHSQLNERVRQDLQQDLHLSQQQDGRSSSSSSSSSHLLKQHQARASTPPQRGKNQRRRFLPSSFQSPPTFYGDDGWYYYDPCTDDYAQEYLNRADVTKAIHAKTPTAFGNGTWHQCVPMPYNYADSLISMVPLWKEIILASGRGDLQILIFSGDNDAVCATMGTQLWIYDLLPIKIPWQEWISSAGLPPTQVQVAGFRTLFNSSASQPALAFITVHAAGHEVS